jgi:hypothetical protein
MIRDHDASRWFFASENDVAATLALHNETDFLQGEPKCARKGPLGFSSWERGGDFDVFTIGLDWDCLAGIADVLQIELDGFFNILQDFRAGVTL